MLFRLAVMSGRLDPDGIGEELTAEQLLEWEAYAELEPFDARRGDMHAAQICGMIYDMAVEPKNRKPYTTWMLSFGGEHSSPAPVIQPAPTKKVSQQELEAKLNGYFMSFDPQFGIENDVQFRPANYVHSPEDLARAGIT